MEWSAQLKVVEQALLKDLKRSFKDLLEHTDQHFQEYKYIFIYIDKSGFPKANRLEHWIRK